MKSKVEIFMGVIMILMILSVSIYYNSDAYYVQAAKEAQKKSGESSTENENDKREEDYGAHTVVIDAGHGGFDPGKIGINNELEKNINLSVSLKLKQKLEANNIRVVMTRSEDIDLGDKGAENQKKSDMRNRMSIINDAGADICISIHQNSYTSQSAKGAQVFYYSGSENGKKLAGLIQKSLIEKMNDGNRRVEKANNSYYLLTKSKCPTVIVECGFLSNWEEATNLKDEYYQDNLAEAICRASLDYLNQLD